MPISHVQSLSLSIRLVLKKFQWPISAYPMDSHIWLKLTIPWLDIVPESKAINEVGLFGNQNTVCQPTTPKGRHTVERLKTYFPKWDQPTG